MAKEKQKQKQEPKPKPIGLDQLLAPLLAPLFDQLELADSDEQEVDPCLDNIAMQALQNAVETANMIGKLTVASIAQSLAGKKV